MRHLLSVAVLFVPSVSFGQFKCVECRVLQQPRGNGVLGDVTSHLNPKHGNTYYSNDLVTWVHETTHGINSDLRNAYHMPAFYLGSGKAVLVKNPKLTLRQIADLIPGPMRKGRHNTYFVKQQKDWNDSPLYPLDEWSAYLRGAAAAEQIPGAETSDRVWAVLEFTVYGMYILRFAEQLDHGYDSAQLAGTVKWMAECSMGIYDRKSGSGWDRGAYLGFVRTHPHAADFREWTVKRFGKDWTYQVLGFQ